MRVQCISNSTLTAMNNAGQSQVMELRSIEHRSEHRHEMG